MMGPTARPSRPSVRLTALELPTMTSTANGMYRRPRSGMKFLKKGTLSFVEKPGRE